MKKVNKINVKNIAQLVLFFVLSLMAGAGIDIAIRPTDNGLVIDTSYTLELSEVQIPAQIDDEPDLVNIPTVEEVYSNQKNAECPDGVEECGLGKYIYAPTETPEEFKDYVIGKCWNTDGYYGSQCWDLVDLFWQNYAGRNFSTCGTHIIKGAWECKEYNAGTEFELIYDPTELQYGDFVLFSSGSTGHGGMATGSYNNGYISLLGQNQGGKPCEGGGSSANIINISLKSFIGAFRPKSYIKIDPEPIPISGCMLWSVKRGDTMSRIMLECEGTVVYGEAMDNYAKSWYSLIYNKGKSVYDGWNSERGVGLFAGDEIEHRVK